MEATAPFPPGEGPFRGKGLLYLDGLDYYDVAVRGGREAVFAALDPALRRFAGERFLASAMYDVWPMLALGQAAARVAGRSCDEVLRETARWVAGRHLGTFFKLMLKMASPETVAVRLARASMRYFNFGDAGSRLTGPGVCESFQTGIPRPLAGWFGAAVEGWAPVALEQAGARAVEVRRHPLLVDGNRFGVETVTLPFQFVWRDE